MKVAIIGAGYVGLPTAVGLAEYGHDIILIEANKTICEDLNNNKLHLYEAGLEDLFLKNREKIEIVSDIYHIRHADIIILAVGTPMGDDGKCDLTYIYKAAEEMADWLHMGQIVVTKSTVPVGTGDEIQRLSCANIHGVAVASMPEFLREGYAVEDFFNPDRIVIGTDSDEVFARIASLYDGHIDNTKIIKTSRRSAELIKYASNAFLAVKIHYANEMANLCEQVGADIKDVTKGMGLDSRIGNKFLNAGVGFGGSCFPKDTRALLKTAENYSTALTLVHDAYYGNVTRMSRLADRIWLTAMRYNTFNASVLGLAFKNGTDDVRYSPAIKILNEMNNFDVIKVYDPKAMTKAKSEIKRNVTYAESIEDCIKGTNIIVILTEWQDFKILETLKFDDFTVILDYRNILDEDIMSAKKNVLYRRIGK